MESQPTATKHLVRRSDDRYIAGVAGGVADYFAIDPVFVRIAFVVLTFVGGAGLIAYVAGWLLIPEAGETTSVGEDALRNRNWARIAGFVLIAIAASIALRPLWWFGGQLIGAVALILIGVYLLTRHGTTSEDGGTPPTPPVPPMPAPPTPAPPTTHVGPVAPVSPSDETIAATDETGAPSTSTAYAWPPPPPAPPPSTTTLPPPPPPPPSSSVAERRRRREERREDRRRRRQGGGVAAMTVGFLLVGAGVIGLVLAAGNGVEPTRVFAAGLLVVGAGLVITAWFGRGTVLIPLGVLLIILMSIASLIDVPFKGGFGQETERPLTVSDVQSEYHLAAGELIVDLGQVNFTSGTTTDVEATVGAGHLVVIVPRDAQVDVQAHAGAGEVHFPGENDDHGGVHVNRDTTLDAHEGAPRIELDAKVGLGQVEVRNAAS
jgi:phage shock protein PspC (stress-responsive transcriptional regulator)